mmetsp:Transcript_5401/g.9710  ORF Transcript_5401/g.9710 Transcript_5401/m.9710 type:complete len:138 (-) Transcript_5401:855-1268(-)
MIPFSVMSTRQTEAHDKSTLLSCARPKLCEERPLAIQLECVGAAVIGSSHLKPCTIMDLATAFPMHVSLGAASQQLRERKSCSSAEECNASKGTKVLRFEAKPRIVLATNLCHFFRKFWENKRRTMNCRGIVAELLL